MQPLHSSSAQNTSLSEQLQPVASSDGSQLDNSTCDAIAPEDTCDHRPKPSHLPEDALDLQTCTIRVRCSNCGMELYVTAPKIAAKALRATGLPPLLAVEQSSIDAPAAAAPHTMERCPNCQESRLYDDGIVSVTIDVVEMYNLRVSGNVPSICVDCRETMCDFSANFLAAIHLAPQAGSSVDLSAMDSTDMRKLAVCRGNLILITDGGDDDVILWALRVSRLLRKQFTNLRPSRYLSGGMRAFRRVFPGLFTPPITLSLPACILSQKDESGDVPRALSFDFTVPNSDGSTDATATPLLTTMKTPVYLPLPSLDTQTHSAFANFKGKTHQEIAEDEYTKAELAMQLPCHPRPWLFLGSAQHAIDQRVIEKLNVTHVINASNRIDNYHVATGVEYLVISVEDKSDASDELSQHIPVIKDFLLRAKSSGGIALVHCMAGVSRSASIAVLAAMFFHQMPLHSAYEHVRACRPVILPNPGFRLLLMQQEIALFGSSSVQGHALFVNAEEEMKMETANQQKSVNRIVDNGDEHKRKACALQ